MQGSRQSKGLPWLCAQRQVNKLLKVIRLIHLDNTEASSYRPLPELPVYSHIHTFLLTGSLPLLLHHHQRQLLQRKEGTNKEEMEEGHGVK